MYRPNYNAKMCITHPIYCHWADASSMKVKSRGFMLGKQSVIGEKQHVMTSVTTFGSK